MKDYKVLVVDDNLINRKMAAAFLQNYGFELFEAESGEKAVELVREIRFDLIFMDYMMPEMDGIEAVRMIRSECGENGRTPVIVALTANSGEDAREIFLNNGFQDFVIKPLDREPLHEILKKWVTDLPVKDMEEERDEDDCILLKEVRSALESMESFRPKECRKKVDDLLSRRLREDVKMRLKAVLEQLERFEDDEAEQLLRSLAERLEGAES